MWQPKDLEGALARAREKAKTFEELGLKIKPKSAAKVFRSGSLWEYPPRYPNYAAIDWNLERELAAIGHGLPSQALVDHPKWEPSQFDRLRAAAALWNDVAASLLFRHPDPTTKVQIKFDTPLSSNGSFIDGQFSMAGIRSTNDPDHQLNDFYMRLGVVGWPGRRCAELWLLGAWMQYMLHEVMELVSVKSKLPPSGTKAPNTYTFGFGFGDAGGSFPDASRVINMHVGASSADTAYHWNCMDKVQTAGHGWLEYGVGLVVGEKAAEKYISSLKDDAERELLRKANELRHT